ncbi:MULTISPECIES: hypothetical protein [Streptomyces]|uniref:Uncharacterized protein n=2 Tax=Streptomyces TaxID=1883 RepID=A0ABW9IPD2_STRGJ|nr:hypothetical protein [Streptomyces bobili]QEU69208.1 hypothetical protein CP966_30985 [Streptomyces galilaeus]GGW48594.1 hypothetical protein GCM10010350_36180 [Streptomyces galilaeus]
MTALPPRGAASDPAGVVAVGTVAARGSVVTDPVRSSTRTGGRAEVLRGPGRGRGRIVGGVAAAP